MTDELPPCRCTCTCDLYGQTLIECLQELEAGREPAVTGPGEDPLRDATNEGYELGLDMLRSVLVAHGIEVCPAADETDQPKEDRAMTITRTIPNRTADLNALPVGTVIRGAATCGGDGIVTEATLTAYRTDELNARLIACNCTAEEPCSEIREHDGCWPWWTDTADGDLDDDERVPEWTVTLPDGRSWAWAGEGYCRDCHTLAPAWELDLFDGACGLCPSKPTAPKED